MEKEPAEVGEKPAETNGFKKERSTWGYFSVEQDEDRKGANVVGIIAVTGDLGESSLTA